MAFVARRASLNDTVTAAEGMARGWKVAGVVILAEGMDPSRVTETEATFDNLVQIKVDELKARYELDPKGMADAGSAEFEQECRAWVPTQQKLIDLMRRGPQ